MVLRMATVKGVSCFASRDGVITAGHARGVFADYTGWYGLRVLYMGVLISDSQQRARRGISCPRCNLLITLLRIGISDMNSYFLKRTALVFPVFGTLH